jgi:HAD superfamily hydrolase (TIGR01490 family)
VTASYFDVDGTLLRTNLIHPTVFYLLNQKTPLHSLGRLAKTALRTPQLALAEMRDRRLFNELLFVAYEGMSHDRLHVLADEAFDTVIKPALFPGAKDLVRKCTDQGHEVVLISGALDFLMKLLADHLGATSVVANRLEFKDGYATGRLLRPVVAGPEKARLVREHARENHHDLDHCFGYSDSYSDVPMLSVVGHPAAVNPDARLERLAHTYGWPVISLEAPDTVSARSKLASRLSASIPASWRLLP